METQQTPLGIHLTYQIIGILFGLVAAMTLSQAILVASRNFFLPSFSISVIYACLNGIVAYGFWKMRKWIISLLIGLILIIAIIASVSINLGIQDINQTLLGFTILGVLFLFTFFSRKFLNGSYKNIKILGLSFVLIILPQVIIFLLK